MSTRNNELTENHSDNMKRIPWRFFIYITVVIIFFLSIEEETLAVCSPGCNQWNEPCSSTCELGTCPWNGICWDLGDCLYFRANCDNDCCWYRSFWEGVGCGTDCSGGGCFTSETNVRTSQGTSQIKDLKVGDEVASQDPQSDKNTTSLVEKIYEVTRSAYYKLTLKDGKEVKVTGEHPLYAIQQSVKPLTFWEYLKSESLTRKAIDFIVSKFQ